MKKILLRYTASPSHDVFCVMTSSSLMSLPSMFIETIDADVVLQKNTLSVAQSTASAIGSAVAFKINSGEATPFIRSLLIPPSTKKR